MLQRGIMFGENFISVNRCSVELVLRFIKHRAHDSSACLTLINKTISNVLDDTKAPGAPAALPPANGNKAAMDGATELPGWPAGLGINPDQ
ncbi:hypothetical protein [Janthinobacterium rivuli]|uniref:hypothetical protein n=1 Tax=Janthinobacterium rivuli TaxID=2751478 RepID=UPI00383BAD77